MREEEKAEGEDGWRVVLEKEMQDTQHREKFRNNFNNGVSLILFFKKRNICIGTTETL